MASLLAPGTVLHGRYTVVQVLRAGAQAALYLGRDAEGAAEQVAIRERSDTSPEAQSAFLEEAALLAKIEHPSLPVVIDHFIEPSGQQYLVTEQVDGPSLAQLLAQSGPLREDQILTWLDRLLAAVEYLHAQRPAIVHGRISPASIVIGADGIPRLLDLFGEVVESEADAESGRDDPYLAPELSSGKVDERTDIYALGATLYTLVTGQKPQSPSARSRGQALPSPRSVNRAVSTFMDGAIVRAMALDPQERFASPAELWRALQKPAPRPGKRSHYIRMVGVVLGLVLLVGAVAGLARLLPALLSRALSDSQASRRRVVYVTATAVATQVPPTAVPLIATVTRAPSIPTPAPTSTSTATSTPTASPVPTKAERATATAVVTVTPIQRVLRAPAPLAPADGAALSGPVEFRWYWPETLQADEYFDVQVWRIGDQPAGIAWSKETSLRVKSLGGGGHYRWRIQVVRGRDGEVLANLTEPSWEQDFSWKP